MMRILVLLMLSAFLISCSKDYDIDDFIPDVELVSATPNPDGTIDLVGKVNNIGEEELFIIGFCADSVPDPNIESNQILVSEIFEDTFYGTIYPFGVQSADNRIYINAFAGNEVGLGKDDAIEITDLDTYYDYPQLASSCTYSENTFYIEGFGTGTFTDVGDPFNPPAVLGSRISATSASGNVQVDFTFFHLETGNYDLVDEKMSYADDEISAELTYDGDSWELASNQKVVINQIDEDVYEIYICSAHLGALLGDEFECRVQVTF